MNSLTRFPLARLLLPLILFARILDAQPYGDYGQDGAQAWLNRPDITHVGSTSVTTAAVTGSYATSSDVLAVAWEAFADESVATDMAILLSLWTRERNLPAYSDVVVATAAGKRTHPLVLDDHAGGFWIVWRDFRDDPAGLLGKLYVQRLRKEGAGWIAAFAANGIPLHATPLALSEVAAHATADSVFVAWGGGLATNAANVHLRVQSASLVGALLSGADGQEIVATAAQARELTWATHPTAGPVLFWTRSINTPFVKVIGSTHDPLNLHAGVTAPPNVWYLDAAVATEGAETYIMLGTGGRDLRLRKLAIDGTGAVSNTWALAGVQVASVGFNSPLRVVPGESPGETYTAWYASQNTYAQKVSATGQPLWDAAGRPLGINDEAPILQKVPGGPGFYLSGTVSGGNRGAKRFDAEAALVWDGSSRTVHEQDRSTAALLGTTMLGGDFVAVLRWSRDVGTGVNLRGLTPIRLDPATGLMPQSRLVNLSTRALVGTGNDVAIAGFVVAGGTGTKDLLVRAVGPTLGAAPFNVAGVVSDPIAELHLQGGGLLHTSDNWGDEADLAALNAATITTGAFALPAGSADSAFVRSYSPAGYTTVVSGVGQATGVALLEAYDLDTADTPGTILHDATTGQRSAKLANLSTRAVAGTGDAVVILGFVVQGPGTSTLLVRCVGPTLGKPPFNIPGVLPNPVFSLHDRDGVELFISKPAGTAPLPQSGLVVQNAASAVGAFALNDANDLGAVLVLNPGLYTVIARGVDGVTGLCLTELYDYPRTNVVP